MVGTIKPHHRFMLSEQFILIDTLDEAIERVGQQIEQRLASPSDAGTETETKSEPPSASQGSSICG